MRLVGSLAQLVEQLAFNQLVAGSNPARPTIFFPKSSSARRCLDQSVQLLTQFAHLEHLALERYNLPATTF